MTTSRRQKTEKAEESAPREFALSLSVAGKDVGPLLDPSETPTVPDCWAWPETRAFVAESPECQAFAAEVAEVAEAARVWSELMAAGFDQERPETIGRALEAERPKPLQALPAKTAELLRHIVDACWRLWSCDGLRVAEVVRLRHGPAMMEVHRFAGDALLAVMRPAADELRPPKMDDQDAGFWKRVQDALVAGLREDESAPRDDGLVLPEGFVRPGLPLGHLGEVAFLALSEKGDESTWRFLRDIASNIADTWDGLVYLAADGLVGKGVAAWDDPEKRRVLKLAEAPAPLPGEADVPETVETIRQLRAMLERPAAEAAPAAGADVPRLKDCASIEAEMLRRKRRGECFTVKSFCENTGAKLSTASKVVRGNDSLREWTRERAPKGSGSTRSLTGIIQDNTPIRQEDPAVEAAFLEMERIVLGQLEDVEGMKDRPVMKRIQRASSADDKREIIQEAGNMDVMQYAKIINSDQPTAIKARALARRLSGTHSIA